jgi:hypothetical protein
MTRAAVHQLSSEVSNCSAIAIRMLSREAIRCQEGLAQQDVERLRAYSRRVEESLGADRFVEVIGLMLADHRPIKTR